MADQVAEVKGKVDVVSVIGSRVELKRAGKNHKGLCPFHAEQTPSFFVSPEMQTYKCFGCGRGGDVFSFLQEYEGLSFREALEVLAEKVGVKLANYRPSGAEDERKKLLSILSLAREYYHFVLMNHKAGVTGREYLKNRGVGKSLMKTFGLGWAPESWDGLLKFLVKKKGYKGDEVEKAGMVIKGSKAGYYDRFRGRVVFPLSDFRGRVVGFSGRVVGDEEKQAKYVNTPETSVYHKRELLYGLEQAKAAIRKKDKVIVVEGEFDVISSNKAGVRNVVGIKGSALSEDQLKLVLRLTPNVVLCLDADASGDAATKRGIEVADDMGMNVEVLVIGEDKDPDGVVRSDPQKWKKMVGKSVAVYKFYIDSAFSRFGASSGVGKKKISEELVPILLKITNSVEQAHYTRELAKRLEVGEQAVSEEMERVRKLEKIEPRESVEEEVREFSREEMLERYVWGLLLSLEGKWFGRGWKLVESVEWLGPGFGRLAGILEKEEVSEFKLASFVKKLPEELAALAGEVYLSEKTVSLSDPEKMLVELEETVSQLEELGKRVRLKALAVKIAEAEKTGNKRELAGLQREYSELIVGLER